MKIIGCGSGRCGTQTFAKMFRLEHGNQVAPGNIHIIKRFPNDVKVVCLKRERSECVASLVKNTDMTAQQAFDYYDLYYALANEYAQKYANFVIFNTETLNTPQDIEKFVGIQANSVVKIDKVCDWCKRN